MKLRSMVAEDPSEEVASPNVAALGLAFAELVQVAAWWRGPTPASERHER